MTLRPVEPVRLSIPSQDWVVYDLPLMCQVPGCSEKREWGGGHHVVRRSATGGPVDWVSIDGQVIANRVALCVDHHRDVTGGVGGHQAWIRFPATDALVAGLYSAWWLWYDRLPSSDRWSYSGPLDPVLYI